MRPGALVERERAVGFVESQAGGSRGLEPGAESCSLRQTELCPEHSGREVLYPHGSAIFYSGERRREDTVASIQFQRVICWGGR